MIQGAPAAIPTLTREVQARSDSPCPSARGWFVSCSSETVGYVRGSREGLLLAQRLWVDDVGAAAAGSGSPGIKSALGTARQKEPASRDIVATEFTDAEPLPVRGNRFPFHLGLFEAGFFHSSQMKESSVCPLRVSRPSVINKPLAVSPPPAGGEAFPSVGSLWLRPPGCLRPAPRSSS